MKQIFIDVSASGEQNKCNLIVDSVFQYISYKSNPT